MEPSPLNHKDILLKKLSCAVICSVATQLAIIIPFVFLSSSICLTNVLYISLFASAIFCQTIICAKKYIISSKKTITRFQKISAFFSPQNWTLLLLHFFVGVMFVWMFCTNVVDHCEKAHFCLNGNSFYYISSGAWFGAFYFLQIYRGDKNISFPVIHQPKWLQFKANFFMLLKNSFRSVLMPTVLFLIFFCIFEESVKDFFEASTRVLVNKSQGVRNIILLPLFGAVIYFHFNLSEFLFELFLTEPLNLNVEQISDGLSLDIPIIQHLASLDLFLLSPCKRHTLFSLSHPGNHPHNWNKLIAAVLKIFKEHSEIQKPHVPEIASPTSTPHNYDKLRKLHVVKAPEPVQLEKPTRKFINLDFLFAELPQQCLNNNAQVLIWLVQSVAYLVAASLKEDQYGTVQKDLPTILTTLVELKTSLEKGRKELHRNAVLAAIKRSLYTICRQFGPYLKDLNLKVDVVLQLQPFSIRY